jgi:hypothetical protein
MALTPNTKSNIQRAIFGIVSAIIVGLLFWMTNSISNTNTMVSTLVQQVEVANQNINKQGQNVEQLHNRSVRQEVELSIMQFQIGELIRKTENSRVSNDRDIPSFEDLRKEHSKN